MLFYRIVASGMSTKVIQIYGNIAGNDRGVPRERDARRAAERPGALHAPARRHTQAQPILGKDRRRLLAAHRAARRARRGFSLGLITTKVSGEGLFRTSLTARRCSSRVVSYHRLSWSSKNAGLPPSHARSNGSALMMSTRRSRPSSRDSCRPRNRTTAMRSHRNSRTSMSCCSDPS
jgi:hypothetical protein